ncbi:sodium/hydrogen exchanger family protein [Colletotrichum tofieldiae]|nr:sodium/hydrogen exchanger family protein [Colletotrichum tofieldiae]
MATTESSLAYHEPAITTIVILSGFLLLLNSVNYGLDNLVYCGLIGQVFLGIAWGTPGAKWLSEEMEHSIVQLGYLGLILIVFEGGLSTSFKSLKANLLLSIGVAITGIAVPIGLSFTLSSMVGATPLQAFAAGAALCSTSLGTTFTVLGTSGLTTTRMGVVLTSAAMMDDVVGLIMVQVVSNLGGGSEFNAVTVVRPVLVSLGFATLVPAACKFVVGPITLRLNAMRGKSPNSKLNHLLRLRQTALVIHTCWLFGLVVGGTFAGTSSLLAAYVAGATISWWDSEVPHLAARADEKKNATAAEFPSTAANPEAVRAGSSAEASAAASSAAASAPGAGEPDTHNTGVEIYEQYYGKAVEHVLKPFFFNVFWSYRMAWSRLHHPDGGEQDALRRLAAILCKPPSNGATSRQKDFWRGQEAVQEACSWSAVRGTWKGCAPADREIQLQRDQRQLERDGQAGDVPLQPLNPQQAGNTPKNASPEPEMPVSVYPACILGFAMVARGEIGYLISALAESTGIFSGGSGSPDQPSEMFLIVTWAITLCTIIGPICVGLLVNRVKRLETQSGKGTNGGRRNVLGAWGVN